MSTCTGSSKQAINATNVNVKPNFVFKHTWSKVAKAPKEKILVAVAGKKVKRYFHHLA